MVKDCVIQHNIDDMYMRKGQWKKEARKDRHWIRICEKTWRRMSCESFSANEFWVRLLVLLKGRFTRSKMIMLEICKFSINLHCVHAYWMWKIFFRFGLRVFIGIEYWSSGTWKFCLYSFCSCWNFCIQNYFLLRNSIYDKRVIWCEDPKVYLEIFWGNFVWNFRMFFSKNPSKFKKFSIANLQNPLDMPLSRLLWKWNS